MVKFVVKFKPFSNLKTDVIFYVTAPLENNAKFGILNSDFFLYLRSINYGGAN